jgi:hypothetical protein
MAAQIGTLVKLILAASDPHKHFVTYTVYCQKLSIANPEMQGWQ